MESNFVWYSNFTAKKGESPLVILFPGSGAVDRDSSFGTFKPFKVIADYLARKGIAVFRFDKRGVGKSTGDFANAKESDFFQDGYAVLKYLQNHNEINHKQIGVIGHSEGGLIASELASKTDEIPFLVLMASPILSGKDNSSLVFTLLVNEDKTKMQNIDEDKKTFDRFFNLMSKNILSPTEKEECIAIATQVLTRITDETKNVMGFSNLAPELFVNIFSIPWLHELLNSNPESILKKIRCPILGIYGRKDTQVPIQNSYELKEILEQSRNLDYTIKEIENANHLFQRCITGYPSEYSTNPKLLIPEVLVLMNEWISDK
ncbi:MAG: alpha/beta fold hydrolase [Candidatus Bathyarchaeota archaeon]|nr:MAG: alpha/beta fold hydrolase [Candidatus Bathyarchaeota archaeon]